MDNASNNETMMQALKTTLEHREIDFDAIDRRIMCFAHVINLCSGQVLCGATNADKDDASESESDASSSESDVDTVAPNPIARARAAVQVIRASGKRRDEFDKVIKQGNKEGWFKQGRPSQVVELKPLQLLRDVRTRWDSVYHMLRRLRQMRPVCHYTSPNVMNAN